MKRMHQRNEAAVVRRGFSLIELLIVLAILVLLATLVAPRLLGSREKAQVDAAKAQIAMFRTPLEMYSLHMSGYPTTEQGLKALMERPAADSGGTGDFAGDDGFAADEDLDGFGMDEDLDALEEEGDGGMNSNWQGPYLKGDKLPKDPWGSAYRYEYPGRNNKAGEPDIWSLGPDRKDNTADDIVSWSGKRNSDGSREDGADEGFDTTEDSAGDDTGVDLGDE